MEIYSIGFTQKSASQFFGTLKAYGIERLLDVRLNNTSQLAAFAKQADLAYFLNEICGAARHPGCVQEEKGKLGYLYRSLYRSYKFKESRVSSLQR